MTRDDIIRMMQSACDTDKVDAWHNDFWTVTQDELERFHAIAVAAEREACIRIIEEHQISVGNSPVGEMVCELTYDALKEIRAAIRARNEQEKPR